MQKALSRDYGKCAAGGKEEEELWDDETMMSTFELKLDFVCDNIFDETLQLYARTGHLFQQIMVPGKTKKKTNIIVKFLEFCLFVLFLLYIEQDLAHFCFQSQH